MDALTALGEDTLYDFLQECMPNSSYTNPESLPARHGGEDTDFTPHVAGAGAGTVRDSPAAPSGVKHRVTV